MPNPFDPWDSRFRWILSVWHWGGLMLGVFVSAVRLEPGPNMAVAGGITGLYVVVFEALPPRLRTIGIAGELLAVAGVLASGSAVYLTGGVDSAYVFLSIAPVFFAATFLGPRAGITTALLATGGLAITVRLLDQELLQGPMLLYSGIYLAIAVSMSQAKRILAEGQASVLLSRVQAQSGERVMRLEEAHSLLTDLSRLADASELNPITAGNKALAAIRDVLTVDAALVALAGPDGPIVVARDGDEVVRHHREVFPLEVGDRDVGFVVVSRERSLDNNERTLVTEALRPLGLAFANILLLRDIARRAVREERVRLARDLHDDIGPSLASLGLALDLAALQYPADADLADHLQSLRHSVTGLVEDVRKTVADLRQPDSASLLARAEALADEVGPDDPRVMVAIDERRAPRPRIVDDLFAILTESVRNAIDHSGAKEVRVEGFVDGPEGKLVIVDDGQGFDPHSDHPGHYGLVGMRERARRIGASLSVESNIGTGTRVSLEWDAR